MRSSSPIAEALWTREDAIAWAYSLKRWPGRRYRVEGSRLGASRLLRSRLAETVRAQHGGTIVELIPPRRLVALERHPCPRCGSDAGAPCLSGGAPVQYVHHVRLYPPVEDA